MVRIKLNKDIASFIKDEVEKDCDHWYDRKIESEVERQLDERSKEISKYGSARDRAYKAAANKAMNDIHADIEKLVDERLASVVRGYLKYLENNLLVELVRRSISIYNPIMNPRKEDNENRKES